MTADCWKCPHMESAAQCRRCDAADVAARVAWCFGGCGLTVTGLQAHWLLGAAAAVVWLTPIARALRRPRRLFGR